MPAARTSPPRPAPSADAAARRPSDRFWPYVDVPPDPTPEELAALDPDLRDALDGQSRPRPFSITLSFRPFEGEAYERALALARASREYRTVGVGAARRHRARFHTADAAALRDLYMMVDVAGACEVLVDDRPVPFARELWLPLVWWLLVR